MLLPPEPSRAAPPPSAPATVGTARVAYHGWPTCLRLTNRVAEVIIAPAVGRILQFHFLGQEDVFWENPALAGHAPDPRSDEWGNFGGDKSWPAPQSDWPNVTRRSWPPPAGFDAVGVAAEVGRAGAVVLTSPVDADYGIRTVRRVVLDPEKPILRITTRYEKVTGPPRQVSVWVITQLRDPEVVDIPLPRPSRFAGGYQKQSEALPRDLKVDDGMVSLRRGASAGTKIGTDASVLIWEGRTVGLHIDAPRVPAAEYPDGGCSAEVWTNPDPLPYVELEMLGPLRTLRAGDRLEATNTYTLFRCDPRSAPRGPAGETGASRAGDGRAANSTGPRH